MTLVEAAVETPESALAAERAGADRIELCENLSEGGTTPGEGLIAAVTERTRIPVFVLIRPRAGGFVYSRNEFEEMTRDIERAGSLGIAGIVTGALTAQGRVDVGLTRALIEAAAGLPVTFHRAIDSAANLPAALEETIEAGASRVLTSGGAATALEGMDVVAALADQAGDRIAVVAAGGIREHNVRDVIARTGVCEVHARLIDEAQMRGLVDAVKGTGRPRNV
ncbi:MAG TPA: copper homeostasis protein CutC [Gemmatimonadaceae bacterium]|nr:copper homeostasis protein CutC [Gemmatimonadaceae bacterium]